MKSSRIVAYMACSSSSWTFAFLLAPYHLKSFTHKCNPSSLLHQKQQQQQQQQQYRNPFGQSPHGFPCRTRTIDTSLANGSGNKEEEEEEEDEGQLFYNDFDFVIGENDEDLSSTLSSSSVSSSSSSKTDALKDRMNILLQEERMKEAQTNRNWKQGNWKVRGFSLDPERTKSDERNNNKKNSDDPSTTTTTTAASTTTPPTSTTDNTAAKDTQESKVIVSCLAKNQAEDVQDDDDNILYVGRSDGSVCVIRLGTEFLTTFTNQLTVTEDPSASASSSTTDNKTILKVSTELKREERPQMIPYRESDRDPDNDDYEDDAYDLQDEDDEDYGEEPIVPFEILYQFQTAADPTVPESSSPTRLSNDLSISHMLVLDDILFTSTKISSQIHIWLLDQENNAERIQTLQLDETMSPLVGLKHAVIDGNKDDISLLVSIHEDGTMALWDVTNLVTTNTIPSVEPLSWLAIPLEPTNNEQTRILSCDIDKEHSYLYLGTSDGKVLIYYLPELVERSSGSPRTPIEWEPKRSFVAYSNEAAVTAIATAGMGTMGRGSRLGSSPSTFAILTGSADGIVKQWEIIEKRFKTDKETSVSLDYWPKMVTQKLPQRAHVFDHNPHIVPLEKNGSIGTSTIRALYAMDNTKFVAVAQSDVLVWNRQSGDLYFNMAGFEFDSSSSSSWNDQVSLCVTQSQLITNGMQQYVCVHDFTIPDFDEEDADFYWEEM